MRKIALDLGCGPGPYTNKLLDAGYDVVAVDFSFQSLKINRVTCVSSTNEIIYIQDDLNDIAFIHGAVDLLIMADFLQHLGGRRQRERMLVEAFNALKIGGRYYLSFFNLNIKNYLKNDIHGDFSGGTILYERLAAKNVISGFPVGISVDKIQPMNVVSGAALDKFLTALPFSWMFSRMISVCGKKLSQC